MAAERSLEGKVALVTAASRGIGLAVAEALAGRGARTAVCGRDEAAVEAAGAKLSTYGDALAMIADLSKPADVDRLLGRVSAELGPIDVLVCNTGGPPPSRFVDITPEDWQQWLGAMFFPVIRLVRAAVPQMQSRGGGAIVFVTSVTVKQPRDGAVLSTTIRSAIAGLSKQLANELGPDNIRVNHVMPGPIETARLRNMLEKKAAEASQSLEERRSVLLREVPLRRLGRPEDIAETVAFLCSDAATFLTGSTFQVDGGQTRSLL